MSLDQPNELLGFTADIVSAHVAHQSSTASDLPALIRSVYGALSNAGTATPPADARPVPAVPIKKSVSADYIICLEDGIKLKMLKRHLQTSYGMTPDQYRARWDLPPTYPMIASNYALQRSALAKGRGLGRKPEAVVEVKLPVVPKSPKRVAGKKSRPSKRQIRTVAATAEAD